MEIPFEDEEKNRDIKPQEIHSGYNTFYSKASWHSFVLCVSVQYTHRPFWSQLQTRQNLTIITSTVPTNGLFWASIVHQKSSFSGAGTFFNVSVSKDGTILYHSWPHQPQLTADMFVSELDTSRDGACVEAAASRHNTIWRPTWAVNGKMVFYFKSDHT